MMQPYYQTLVDEPYPIKDAIKMAANVDSTWHNSSTF